MLFKKPSTPSVLLRQVGEPPDVSQPDGVPDGGQDEGELRVPGLPRLPLAVLPLGRGGELGDGAHAGRGLEELGLVLDGDKGLPARREDGDSTI